MAALVAPYHNAMRLGSGFNSFTQELCIDQAVVSPDDRVVDHSNEGAPEIKDGELPHDRRIAQSVTYKTSVIDKATDVTDALNINAALTIKHDKIDIAGKGDFVNTNTLKTSDLNFMISVKVVNDTTVDRSLTKFSPISGIKPGDFAKVYGDCFISGFQEGGEFNALISIKVLDREQLETITADATAALTSEKIAGDVKGKGEKIKSDIFADNKVTISVSWVGGGQNLKKPDEDWTYDTMRAAALKFPELVAKTPMRTNAILTKYMALKSFHAAGGLAFLPQSYEHVGIYTSALQEAYLDYKNILKDIQVLAFDVAVGAKTLTAGSIVLGKDFAETSLKASKPALLADMSNMSMNGSDSASSDNGETFTDVKKPDTHPLVKVVQPLVIEKPYPPTVFGLEAARIHCRFMMNRIGAEVDAVAADPKIATDELRPLPYMSPSLFRLLLPVSQVS